MSMFTDRAAQVTVVPAGSTDFVISGGRTITVYGVWASNAGGSTESVILERFNSAALATNTITLATLANFQSPVEWLAQFGLQITTGANTTATIFHSHGGD